MRNIFKSLLVAVAAFGVFACSPYDSIKQEEIIENANKFIGTYYVETSSKINGKAVPQDYTINITKAQNGLQLDFKHNGEDFLPFMTVPYSDLREVEDKILYKTEGIFYNVEFSLSSKEMKIHVESFDVDLTAINTTLTNMNSAEDVSETLKSLYLFLQPMNDDGFGLESTILLDAATIMDVQPAGKYAKWNPVNYKNGQPWDGDDPKIVAWWKHAYRAIATITDFINDVNQLNDEVLTLDEKTRYVAEARALRGFFYHWLITNFGSVPMWESPETLDSFVNKEIYPDEIVKLIDYLIEDFTFAANNLSWSNNYGRMTKGASLAYLGDLYLLKAVYSPEQKDELYKKANECYSQIIDSSTYQLLYNYSTLWDTNLEIATGEMNKETIWATDININGAEYAACPGNGGNGLIQMSWEWFNLFEKNDRRVTYTSRMGFTSSFESILAKWGINLPAEYSQNNQHPFLDYQIEALEQLQGEVEPQAHLMYEDNGVMVPSLWNLKYWRNSTVEEYSGKSVRIYWKRYSEVLLKCAFTHFALKNDQRAWGDQIAKIRERAFGNLEVGQDFSKYVMDINIYRNFYGLSHIDSYPIEQSCEVIMAPDAKEYYTKVRYIPNRFGTSYQSSYNNINSENILALAYEYIKEFCGEPGVRTALLEFGCLEDVCNYRYPIDNATADANYPWRINSGVDYKMWEGNLPIPSNSNRSPF